MRYPIIDGFRGYFLCFMMVMHADMQIHIGTYGDNGTLVGALNHHSFGYVEDAQGFVLISGIVVGLVYGRILLSRGFGDMARAVRKRILTIYKHVLLLTMVGVMLALAFASFSTIPPSLEHIAEDPFHFLASVVLLLNAPFYVGILNLYIWLMILTPLALWLLYRGQTPALLAVSLFVWFLAQFGVFSAVRDAANAALEARDIAVELGHAFYITGWQVIYVAGLTVGFRLARGKLDLSFLKRPEWTGLFHVALGIAAFFFGLKICVGLWVFSPPVGLAILEEINRPRFSAVYLFNFVAYIVIVVWLLNVGRNSGVALWRLAGNVIHWIMTRRLFILMGQHSLFVFSTHVVAIYALKLVVDERALDPLTGNLIVLLSPLPMFLAALAKQHWRDRERRVAAA